MSPALLHDVVDVLWTVLRLGETLALLVDLVQDLDPHTDGGIEVAGQIRISVYPLMAQLLLMCVCVRACVHLAPIKAQPRLLSVCEHLPQSDSKHPRVSGVREGSSLQALWGAPAREQTSTMTEEQTLQNTNETLTYVKKWLDNLPMKSSMYRAVSKQVLHQSITSG